jgi:GT2 family glycosyltransferase
VTSPLVSVLVPVRDVAGTLDEALASVCGQTLRELEVVVVDDGSSDGTREAVQAWAARDARVRAIVGPPRGLVAALNEGLAACEAPIVARMDGDDVAHPERLAAQLEHLRAHPDVDLVATAAEAFVDAPGRLGGGMVRYLEWSNALLTHEQMLRERFVESPVVHPTIAIRRATLERVGGYREAGWPEDYDLWLRLFAAGARFAKLPRTLLRWRDRPARATRTDARYAPERHRELKLAFLLEGPLADATRPIVFWGAGLEGKPLLRALRARGRSVPFVLDIDPRKIGAGNVVHGARVVHERALPQVLAAHPDAIVLVAVGVPTARPLIRQALHEAGLQEGERALFLC